jgi:hypothetical protein
MRHATAVRFRRETLPLFAAATMLFVALVVLVATA